MSEASLRFSQYSSRTRQTRFAIPSDDGDASGSRNFAYSTVNNIENSRFSVSYLREMIEGSRGARVSFQSKISKRRKARLFIIKSAVLFSSASARARARTRNALTIADRHTTGFALHIPRYCNTRSYSRKKIHVCNARREKKNIRGRAAIISVLERALCKSAVPYAGLLVYKFHDSEKRRESFLAKSDAFIAHNVERKNYCEKNVF